VTLGGRRIDLQNGSVDNATFASFLWQPDLCVPLRIGAEYSLLESRKNRFGSETWIGVTYGINPSINGAIIRRTVSPDGKSSDIGFSGTMQISF